MNSISQSTDVLVANAAVKTTYFSAIGTGILSFLGSNHFAVICGAIASIGAMFIAWYYKAQDNERKKRAEARLILSHELDLKERAARIKKLEANSNSGFGSLTSTCPVTPQEGIADGNDD